MRPFDLFLLTSVKASEISCSNAVFKLFTGGLLNSSVAIPVLSSTERLTSFWFRAADTEKHRTESVRKQCLAAKKLIFVLKKTSNKKFDN